MNLLDKIRRFAGRLSRSGLSQLGRWVWGAAQGQQGGGSGIGGQPDVDRQAAAAATAFYHLAERLLRDLQRELGDDGQELRQVVQDAIRRGASPTEISGYINEILDLLGKGGSRGRALDEAAGLTEEAEKIRAEESRKPKPPHERGPRPKPTPVHERGRPKPRPVTPVGAPPLEGERSQGVQFERVTNSSNVWSFGYDYTTETLYVRYKAPNLNRKAVTLDGKGGGKGILGRTVAGKANQAGPLYAYFNVPRRKFEGMQQANSKGKFVWDHLRRRGSVWQHQHPYRLIDTGLAGGVSIEYAPRRASKSGFEPRALTMASGRTVRSPLPRQTFAKAKVR